MCSSHQTEYALLSRSEGGVVI